MAISHATGVAAPVFASVSTKYIVNEDYDYVSKEEKAEGKPVLGKRRTPYSDCDDRLVETEGPARKRLCPESCMPSDCDRVVVLFSTVVRQKEELEHLTLQHEQELKDVKAAAELQEAKAQRSLAWSQDTIVGLREDVQTKARECDAKHQQVGELQRVIENITAECAEAEVKYDTVVKERSNLLSLNELLSKELKTSTEAYENAKLQVSQNTSDLLVRNEQIQQLADELSLARAQIKEFENALHAERGKQQHQQQQYQQHQQQHEHRHHMLATVMMQVQQLNAAKQQSDEDLSRAKARNKQLEEKLLQLQQLQLQQQPSEPGMDMDMASEDEGAVQDRRSINAWPKARGLPPRATKKPLSERRNAEISRSRKGPGTVAEPKKTRVRDGRIQKVPKVKGKATVKLHPRFAKELDEEADDELDAESEEEFDEELDQNLAKMLDESQNPERKRHFWIQQPQKCETPAWNLDADETSYRLHLYAGVRDAIRRDNFEHIELDRLYIHPSGKQFTFLYRQPGAARPKCITIEDYMIEREIPHRAILSELAETHDHTNQLEWMRFIFMSVMACLPELQYDAATEVLKDDALKLFRKKAFGSEAEFIHYHSFKAMYPKEWSQVAEYLRQDHLFVYSCRFWAGKHGESREPRPWPPTFLDQRIQDACTIFNGGKIQDEALRRFHENLAHAMALSDNNMIGLFDNLTTK